MHKTSKTTISNITQGLTPKHKDKVDTIVAVKTELYEESGQEVDAVNREIEERTKHLILFQNSAARKQVVANKVLKTID